MTDTSVTWRRSTGSHSLRRGSDFKDVLKKRSRTSPEEVESEITWKYRVRTVRPDVYGVVRSRWSDPLLIPTF